MQLVSYPLNIILLAAGRGSRLLPLTESTHKSLLPVCGKPVLQYAVDQIIAAGCSDIVCVTGYKQNEICQFLAGKYENRVRTIQNDRYGDDLNILSTELGVTALRNPQLGYLIVETDILMEDAGWRSVLSEACSSLSFWVTKGYYSPTLTGGALRVDGTAYVSDMVYEPNYRAEFQGWQKLLGILYVGAHQVDKDRSLRQSAIKKTISQYYMMPWSDNLVDLPCVACDLRDIYASSYNDLATYQKVAHGFEKKVGAI